MNRALPSKTLWSPAATRAFVVGCVSLAIGMIVWEYAARRYFTPVRLPPLSLIWQRAVESTLTRRSAVRRAR